VKASSAGATLVFAISVLQFGRWGLVLSPAGNCGDSRSFGTAIKP
jgi:hypothetical protein